MSVVRKAPARDVVTESLFEFVFSDATRDRHGDTINPHGWDIREFQKNPIALLNHNPDFPIGRWTNTRVENNQLLGHLQLAPEGTSARIDEVRKLIFARVLCSCSVGFVPLEQELSGKGISFKRQRLLECSVVSIPSNASAQWVEAKKIEARHLGINSDSIDRIFRQNKNATLAERQANAKRVLGLSRAKATLARTAHLAKPKPAPATSRSYPFLT